MTINIIYAKKYSKFIDKQKKILKEDRLISLAIMSSFAILTIQYLVLYYFNISENSTGSQIQLMSKAIVAFLFLISLPAVLKRNWIMFITVYIISIIIFLSNYLIFPQNSKDLMSVVFPFFFTCLPSFVYSFSINDKNTLLKMINMVSNIVFIFGTFIGILVFTAIISIEAYSMPLSYYMLLPAIINMYNIFVKKELTSSILKVIISLMVILALGSRGAVLCLGVYIIIASIRNAKTITHVSLLRYGFFYSLVILGIIFLKNIIMLLNEFLMKFGIRSRTLYLFMQDNIYSGGRDKLYDVIIGKITENPIIGIGIAGDRVYLGGYSHNIFFEILSGFGVIIGSFIIATIVWISYKAISNKNILDSNIIIIWFSLGFVSLIVSGTYLKDFTFWIFLGLAIRAIKYAHLDVHSGQIDQSLRLKSTSYSGPIEQQGIGAGDGE